MLIGYNIAPDVERNFKCSWDLGALGIPTDVKRPRNMKLFQVIQVLRTFVQISVR